MSEQEPQDGLFWGLFAGAGLAVLFGIAAYLCLGLLMHTTERRSSYYDRESASPVALGFVFSLLVSLFGLYLFLRCSLKILGLHGAAAFLDRIWEAIASLFPFSRG